MKIINGERGSGRTTILIHTAYTTGARIVCPDNSQARFVKETAQEEGLEILEPMGFREFMEKSCRGLAREEKVLFDNADMALTEILRDYFHAEVTAITINCPNVLKSHVDEKTRESIKRVNPEMYAEEYAQ